MESGDSHEEEKVPHADFTHFQVARVNSLH